jgi:mannose-6-phosphate isomerase-like protein (cupin superfamily)
VVLGAVVLIAVGLVGGGEAQDAKHVVLTARDITWTDAPPILPPGAKIAVIEGVPASPGPFTFRLKLPDGYRVAPHWHPAIEHVTVLAGAFNFGTGEKFEPGELRPLPAGSFVAIPPRHAHFVSATGETVIQIHGVGPWGLTYVNPEEDPRRK